MAVGFWGMLLKCILENCLGVRPRMIIMNCGAVVGHSGMILIHSVVILIRSERFGMVCYNASYDKNQRKRRFCDIKRYTISFKKYGELKPI